MNNKLIICDIDNTLLFTDELNSESYIEAAKALNISLPHIVKNSPRITSALIKEYVDGIDDNTLHILQEEKLNYFLNHLDKIVINYKLLDIIKEKSNYSCLWTSSNKQRALSECEALSITYDELISFDKDNANMDVLKKILSEITAKYRVDNANVIVYDDDESFLKKIDRLGFKTVLVKR